MDSSNYTSFGDNDQFHIVDHLEQSEEEIIVDNETLYQLSRVKIVIMKVLNLSPHILNHMEFLTIRNSR